MDQTGKVDWQIRIPHTPHTNGAVGFFGFNNFNKTPIIGVLFF